MQEEALRAAIARNIAFYRRQQGQTQAELAEQLNYSDKSVSKWERGEGVPDIYILARLAEMYGVTVNDLVCLEPPQPRRRPPYLLITLLSLGLVWLVAAVAFFACLLLCPGCICALFTRCPCAPSCWWSFPRCGAIAGFRAGPSPSCCGPSPSASTSPCASPACNLSISSRACFRP